MKAVLLLCCAAAACAQPVRVAFLYSDGNIPSTIEAYKTLLEERPDLRGKVDLSFLTESVFDDAKTSDLTQANVLVLDTMNEQLLDRFDSSRKVDLIGAVKKRGKVCRSCAKHALRSTSGRVTRHFVGHVFNVPCAPTAR